MITSRPNFMYFIQILKKLVCPLLCSFFLISCHQYNLDQEDFKGISLSGPKQTQKVEVTIRSQARCDAEILLSLNEDLLTFSFSTTLDTIYRTDWYDRETFVTVDYDSCVSSVPEIQIRFLNTSGL